MQIFLQYQNALRSPYPQRARRSLDDRAKFRNLDRDINRRGQWDPKKGKNVKGHAYQIFYDLI